MNPLRNRRLTLLLIGLGVIAAICWYFQASAGARVSELEREVSALRLQLEERDRLLARVPEPLPSIPIARPPDKTAALQEQVASLSAKVADLEREASGRNRAIASPAPGTKQERLAHLGQIRHALAEQAQVYREARAELNRIAAPFNVHLSNIDASILLKKTFTPLDQDPAFRRAVSEVLAEKRVGEAGRLKYADERRQILQMP